MYQMKADFPSNVSRRSYFFGPCMTMLVFLFLASLAMFRMPDMLSELLLNWLNVRLVQEAVPGFGVDGWLFSDESSHLSSGLVADYESLCERRGDCPLERVYLKVVQASLLAGDIVTARKYLKSETRNDIDSELMTKFFVGLIYWVSDRPLLAIKYWRSEEVYWNYFRKLAWWEFDQGETEKAIEMFELVTTLRPDYADGYLVLGDLYWGRDWKRAEQSLRTAAELDPGSRESWLALGKAELVAGNWGLAVADLSKALEFAPSDVRTQLYLARAALQMGDFVLAEKNYLAVLAGDPKNDMGAKEWAFLGLGRIALVKGDYCEAYRRFMSAAELGMKAEDLDAAFAELELLVDIRACQ